MFFNYLKKIDESKKSKKDLDCTNMEKCFILKEEKTLRQLIEDIVVIKDEWGYISIDVPGETFLNKLPCYVEYEYDCVGPEIPQVFLDSLDKQIESVRWHGCRSRGDWFVRLKD